MPASATDRIYAELPDDAADAFERFKLVILAGKMTNWAEVDRDMLLAALDALKSLAETPVEATQRTQATLFYVGSRQPTE